MLRKGLQQGSVLAPLLFLFVIDSLRDYVPAGVECPLYANNVALWSQSCNQLEAQAVVWAAVNAVHAWSLKKTLTRKCEVSFFSPSTQETRWRPTATLGRETICFNATSSFLGVKLGWSLNFIPHTEKVVATVVNHCRLLGVLVGRCEDKPVLQ